MYNVQTTGFISQQNGIMTIRSTGYGTDKEAAIESAELNAIEQLLFRGFPKSQQVFPLVSVDEITARKQHKRYFNEFLDNGRYKTFILSSIPVSNFARHGRKKRNITMEIRVNLNTLRSDLEAQGVIRKFGY